MDDDEGMEMRWCLRAGKTIHTEKVAKLFEVACNHQCGYWLHHNHITTTSLLAHLILRSQQIKILIVACFQVP
jgi:hypothetical protein